MPTFRSWMPLETLQATPMHAPDYAIIAAYLAIVLLLGRRSKAGTGSEEAFFLAGRKLGKLRQFFFNFGHSTDANTAVSTVSFVYGEGASGAWLQLQMIFLNPYYWFMSVWFRRARLTTTAELFEERLESRRLAQLYAVFQIGVAIIGIAFSNFVAYKVTSALIDGGPMIQPVVFYSGFVAIVGLYVAMGGLEGTVLNQMFQGILVLVFSVILLPFGFRALGSAGLHARLPERMFDIFAAGNGGQFTIWAVLAIMTVSVIQINGNIINMGLAGSARNEFAARFGAVSGTYGKRVMIVLWVFVGLIAAGLRQGNARLSDPDSAWGSLSLQLLGPGFLGLMLVGLLAANMASVATKTMAISALFVRNIYRPQSPGQDDKREVRMAQAAGALALGISVLVALAMRETIAVTKLILTINVPFGSAILLMFFWRRLTKTAVWWSVFLTVALIVVEPLGARATGNENFSAGAWLLRHSGLAPEGCGPGGLLAAQFFFDAIFPFTVLMGVSLVTSPPPAVKVDQFFGKMKTPVGADRELDAMAMEATRQNPRRFEGNKLFRSSSWEFTKWDRVDAGGFIACCVISTAIIAAFWMALSAIR
jgi:SSS family solute:Na+ symporter